MNKKLTFLHLSDIHFYKHIIDEKYDLDKDLRNELELDCELMREELGPPNGILVSGDLVFSGTKDEFDNAWEWLTRLCKIVGCGTQSILTIPGNHDVDRSKYTASRPIRDFHSNMRKVDLCDLESTLVEYLTDSAVVYEQLENYNNLAAKVLCDLSPKDPYWERSFELNDQSKLVIRGLNSTLISNKLDKENENLLIVGQHQYQLERQHDRTYMVMCHHPPSWLRDGENLENFINERARLQLFGHKHVQKLDTINNSLRLSAGAVHPSRKEKDWKPCYNWISMSVQKEETHRTLLVYVYPRVLTQKKKFAADLHECEEAKNYKEIRLKLESWTSPMPATLSTGSAEAAEDTACAVSAVPIPGGVPVESSSEAVRTLAHRFLTLPFLKRFETAHKLKLLREEDSNLSERERGREWFQRALSMTIEAELWDEVECHHADKHLKNPFRK